MGTFPPDKEILLKQLILCIFVVFLGVGFFIFLMNAVCANAQTIIVLDVDDENHYKFENLPEISIA